MGYSVAKSKKLTNLRTARGWSQKELAARVGISRKNVVDLEREWPEKINTGTLIALADVFCVTVDELLRGDTMA